MYYSMFLHHLFQHNAWIPESSYYSENYAGIIALSLCICLSVTILHSALNVTGICNQGDHRHCPELLRPGSGCIQMVKADSRSNSQVVCWNTIYSTTGDQRCDQILCTYVQLIKGGQCSRVKSVMVKQFSTVKNLEPDCSSGHSMYGLQNRTSVFVQLVARQESKLTLYDSFHDGAVPQRSVFCPFELLKAKRALDSCRAA